MTLFSFMLFGLGLSVYFYPKESFMCGWYTRHTEVLYGFEVMMGRVMFSLDTDIPKRCKEV